MSPVWIVILIIVVVVVWLIAMYNGLIRRRNRVEEALSDIDVQLKRRYELIPNLVNTVKGYATHEREIFEHVAELRSQIVTGSTAEKVAANNQLTDTLKSLFAVAENYPDLKANQNFLGLQSELTDSQDKIMAAQRFYNSNVRDFNTSIQSFPANLLAGSLGFKPYEFVEAAPGERENVNVQF
jgi:LemA protein